MKRTIRAMASIAMLFIFFASSLGGRSVANVVNAQNSGNNTYLPQVMAPQIPVSENAWPMVGANPERTSWTPEEVRGNLSPLWARPILPYINYKIQIIASSGMLFISSARGLYALNADNGNVNWVYATEMPLGNSPTIYNRVAYVGGYDKRIHAVDIFTGTLIPSWNFVDAGAGFETNPLVVDGTVFAGNRDGYFYALDAITGSLKWKFKTGGPILYSPAYKNGILYFASNDSYAYAIKAVPDNPNNTNGQLVWKSIKFPGAGFHSYWPVIFTDKKTGTDYVIFSGSQNIHNYDDQLWLERDSLYPNHDSDTPGTLIGPMGSISGNWAPGTATVDVSKINQYLENSPNRRVVFLLNAQNGQEYTYDSNGNGKQEYIPFTWAGVTHSGNKYPPIVGIYDNVIYQFATYVEWPWIPRGQVAGWTFGSHYISRVASDDSAVDEPMAFSGGGRMIYWSLCCDRAGGGFDTSIPYGQSNRAWHYFLYDLRDRVPNYQPMYYGNDYNGWGLYGNVNGIYGKHGTQNPPIPYRGKLYMQKGNSIIAFGPRGTSPNVLPLAGTGRYDTASSNVTVDELKGKLESEVSKIVSNPSSFLRPGYHGSGQIANWSLAGDRMVDYFHNPSDTLYTLIQALPYLSPTLQNQTRTYLQQFFNRFPVYEVASVGWKDGTPREVFDIPSDALKYFSSGPEYNSASGQWWSSFPPDSFYGAWKYAQVFGGAKNIFDNMKAKLETPPADSYLISKPYILNAFINGYMGYLELEKLAGYPETAAKKSTYTHLLSLRSSQFTKDSPYVVPDSNGGVQSIDYNRSLNVSRNFMFMTPELGNYLHDTVLSQVQTAVSEYNVIAPYWFVSKYDGAAGETALQHIYDYQAIFQAKAYILKQPRSELAKYLDVPAFEKGDLFYIQNLVAAIQAP